MHNKSLYAQKRLGQVFLRDSRISERIIQCATLAPHDTVVEIGPGQGALTEILAQQALTLYAIEVDARYAHQLQQRFAAHTHVHIVHADARRYDYSLVPHPFVVIANLPYSVGMPILTNLFLYRHHIARLVIMLQKEVALRLLAAPGTSAYGAVSVFFQYYASVHHCFHVSRTAFTPVPAVDSTVLTLTPFSTPPLQCSDEPWLFRVVHWAFMHRRKTLRANLLAIPNLGLDKAILASLWSRLHLSHNVRPQELSVTHFVHLAENLRVYATAEAQTTGDATVCPDAPNECVSQNCPSDPMTNK